jgi:hypothetical protein
VLDLASDLLGDQKGEPEQADARRALREALAMSRGYEIVESPAADRPDPTTKTTFEERIAAAKVKPRASDPNARQSSRRER